jgi:predicted nucleic acid-binding protein
MITVDASVWAASLDPRDRFHADSVACLRACERRRLQLFAPAFAVIETGCALARRMRDCKKALVAARGLQSVPALRLLAMEGDLLAESLALGTECFLRGADALYAATARLTGTTLLTWDHELIERGGGMTPSEWLARNP